VGGEEEGREEVFNSLGWPISQKVQVHCFRLLVYCFRLPPTYRQRLLLCGGYSSS
jgi:hypothetical protein